MAKPRRAAKATGETATKKAKTPKKQRTRGQKVARVFMWIGVGLLSLILIGVIGIVILWNMVDLPDPNAEFSTNTTVVYYNDGTTQLGTFQVQNRRSISYTEIPQYVKDALVASENRTFWTDPGFDVFGMVRAVGSAVLGGETMTGASTITQQYVKIFYLTSERSLSRKVKEVILAAKIGQQYSKEEILTNYLNTVYYGRGAYGIEAASLAFFKKSAKDLDLAESVVLTSVINNPAGLDPANGEQQRADLLERYQYTLKAMVEMNYITDAERLAIYADLPEFPEIKKSNIFGGAKGFLLQMVQDELLANGFTEAEVTGGGLRVTTTFDKKDQDALVKVAKEYTLEAAGNSKKKAADLHAGVASIDNATGEVLAVYGGPDYVENSRNWATTPRPVGSTFKPYALTAALEQGWVLSDKVNGSSFTPKGESKPVRNAGRNWGRISLLNATTHSVNSAFVDLTMQLENGGQDVLDAANDCGVPSLPDRGWEANNRVALGTPEISPLNQAAGYSTFANEGHRVKAHVVREVKDMAGEVQYTAEYDEGIPLDRAVIRDVTYALTKVTQDGTGSRAAALDYPVAGKTGTAWYNDPESGLDKTVAAWFVGYTKQITTAVMFVAGDDGMGDLDDFTGGFYGSGFPAKLWLAYMETAMEGMDEEDFSGPTDRKSTRSAEPKPTETDTGEIQRPSDEPTETAATSEPVLTPEPTPTPEPTEPVDNTTPAPQPTETTPEPQPTETTPPPEQQPPVQQQQQQQAQEPPPG
ncbi:MAG: penicillin-binding protein [Propionibacteriaceae bacterium]|jgi:membrane peptidoglycan carboxypeptidase|nr:penicillin-binding protein [Propionibacteriaceae bacterium]